jgi:hypothetical protein
LLAFLRNVKVCAIFRALQIGIVYELGNVAARGRVSGSGKETTMSTLRTKIKRRHGWNAETRLTQRRKARKGADGNLGGRDIADGNIADRDMEISSEASQVLVAGQDAVFLVFFP